MSTEAKDPSPSRKLVAAGAEAPTEQWAWVRPFVVRVGINALTLLATLIVCSLIIVLGSMMSKNRPSRAQVTSTLR